MRWYQKEMLLTAAFLLVALIAVVAIINFASWPFPPDEEFISRTLQRFPVSRD